MGQTSGQISQEDSEEDLPEELLRQVRSVTQFATVTLEEFHSDIDDINSLAQKCMDCSGNQIKFEVVEGSDQGLFWKAKTRINCVKYNEELGTRNVQRTMSFFQFIRTYRSIRMQFAVAETVPEGAAGGSDPKLGEADFNQDCCVCLERKPDVMLPCMHFYCQSCITRWNVSNHSCPICRQEVDSGLKDSWVISSAPSELEVSEDLITSVMDIAE